MNQDETNSGIYTPPGTPAEGTPAGTPPVDGTAAPIAPAQPWGVPPAAEPPAPEAPPQVSPLGAPLAPEPQHTSPLGAPLPPPAPEQAAVQPPAGPFTPPPAAPAAPAYGTQPPQPPVQNAGVGTPVPPQAPPAAPAAYGDAPDVPPPSSPAFGQPATVPPQAPQPPLPPQQPPYGAPPQQPPAYGGPGAPAPQPQPGYPPVGGPQPGGPAPGGYPQPPYGAPPPQQPAPKKKKKKTWLVILIIVVVVIGALVGGFFIYTSMQKDKLTGAYAAGDYSGVVATYEGTSWIQGDYTKEYDYSRARLLLDAGDTDAALDIFDSLGGFADSADLADAARYDVASDMLADGDLQGSLKLFKQLGRYRDSADIASDIEAYLDASALEDPMARYYAFTELGDFLDSADLAYEAVQPVYEQAVSLYLNGEISSALDQFYNIPDILDSATYIYAIELFYEADSYYNARDARGYLATFQELEQEIDITPLIFRGNLFIVFLEGNWSSAAGGSFDFSLTTELYDFSAFPEVNGSYYFEDGVMEPVTKDGRPYVYFTYIDYNTIDIQIGSGNIYTFYRN